MRMPLSQTISFRRLEPADLPLLQRWLGTPHVAEWWGGSRPSLAEVECEYLPCIEGREPTRCYPMLLEGRPVGFIQTCLMDDFPEHSQLAGLPGVVAGVDLLIGESDALHRGLGAPILQALLREVVFADPGVERCLIDPAESNRVAIRCYEKAGFQHVTTVQMPGEGGLTCLMVIERSALPSR